MSFHLNKSKRYADAKELSIIGRITYSFLSNTGVQRRQFKFATGKTCPVKKFKKGRVDSHLSNATLINSTLVNFQRKAQKLYDQFEETKKFPQPDAFRNRLLQDTITVTEERNFVNDFGTFIEYLQNKGASVSTVKNMRVGLNHLKAMSEQEGCALDYSNIDLNFYGKLKKYFLITNKSKINTFGRGVKTLKTFLNYAKSLGWNKYEYYKHTEFKILTEESDIVALTEDEVIALNRLDLAKRPRLALTRDYFVLACETSPRYSDYSKLNKNQIKEVNGGYNLDLAKTQKTGVRVVIPLSRLAFDVLKRNGFNLAPPPTNQKFNENLKELAKLAEIKKNISSHTARKTFCTTQYRLGTPVPWIMKISGHRTEKEFYKYIGVALEENADMVRNMHERYKIGGGEILRPLKVAL